MAPASPTAPAVSPPPIARRICEAVARFGRYAVFIHGGAPIVYELAPGHLASEPYAVCRLLGPAEELPACYTRVAPLALDLRPREGNPARRVEGAGMSSDTLRRLAPGPCFRSTVRELARSLAERIRGGGATPSPADRQAVAQFLDAMADVSTPAASFELRMLAREIGGR